MQANTKKEKYQLICEKKMRTSIEELRRGYPKEFEQYLSYCRSLRFTDIPEYDYLRKLFRDLLFREGLSNDGVFDWDIEQQKRQAAAAGGSGGAGIGAFPGAGSSKAPKA